MEQGLMTILLIIAMLFATKHAHAFWGSIAGRMGGGSGGSFLGSAGGAVAGKAVNTAAKGIRKGTAGVGGKLLGSMNQAGGKGLDGLRNYLDDKGILDKGEGETQGIGSGLKHLAGDAMQQQGIDGKDVVKELGHRALSKSPSLGMATKHQALADMYKDKRNDSKDIRRERRGAGNIDHTNQQYKADQLAHNLAKHRYDELVNRSPEALQLQKAQQSYDLASNKKFAAGDLQTAKENYQKFLQSDHVKHAQQEVEQTSIKASQSKDAYMEQQHKHDSAILRQSVLDDQFDMKKALFKAKQ